MIVELRHEAFERSRIATEKSTTRRAKARAWNYRELIGQFPEVIISGRVGYGPIPIKVRTACRCRKSRGFWVSRVAHSKRPLSAGGPARRWWQPREASRARIGCVGAAARRVALAFLVKNQPPWSSRSSVPSSAPCAPTPSCGSCGAESEAHYGPPGGAGCPRWLGVCHAAPRHSNARFLLRYALTA